MLTNTLIQLTISEAEQTAEEILLENLGILLLGSEVVLPLWPFIVLGVSLLNLLSLFDGGRPKFQDTDALIAAYRQSAYWPLHALASDLQIAANNGAPISDSNPAVQAQFSKWKQGTITSIQGFAGVDTGPSGPGYWQLQQLINLSWVWSAGGQGQVLQAVRAIDQFTIGLSELAQQSTTVPPPPPGPPSPPTPVPNGGAQPQPCDSGQSDQDEILDSCIATQASLAAIVAAIQALNQPRGTGDVDPCCKAVVTAIGNVTAQLANITALLAAPTAPRQTIDLSGIVAALGELATAVGKFPPLLEAITAAIANGLGSIATALGPDLGKAIQNIADGITSANQDNQVPAAWTQALLSSGAVFPELAQLYQGTVWETVIGAGAHAVGYALGWGLGEVTDIVDRIFSWLIIPFAKIIWKILTDLVSGFEAGAGTAPQTWINVGKALLTSLDGVITTLFGGSASAILQYYEGNIAGINTTTDAGINQVVQILMGRAFEAGMLAHLIATLPELAYFTKQIGLNSTAALLAEFAGFHEVLINTHRPFMTAALGRPATYLYNRNYPTTMPVGPAALALWARRKISDTDAQYLMASAGYNARWQTPEFAGAYRPVQPRTLVQLFLDQPIDQNVLTTMLRDTALSENNVALMAQAITYKSIANVRNAYLAALISGYQKGVVGDDELQEALTDFNFSPQAQQYVKSHVLILRREVLAQKVQSEIVPLVATGGMTPEQGLQQLETAGLQPWLAELEITLATTKADIAILKKQLALEAKTLLQEQRNATRAAVAEFQRGVIDQAGLTAALIALGLDPVLIGSVVAVQNATRTGRMKYLWGQLLSPADARTLTERAGAITTQVKETLITSDQALAQLKALGVDNADADAIVARAIAALGAASTRGTLLSPLTGQPP